MKWFRQKLRSNRLFILTLLAVNVFNMVDGRQFVYAHQLHEKEEERLKEISELLDVPVEKLRPDHESLFESLRDVLGIEPEDPVKAAGLQRLQEVLRKHEEQLAANPYLPQIEEVKREHQIHRIEGMIQDLLQLTQPTKALPEGSQKAILRNLHQGLKDRVELPPLPEEMPAKAQAKHAEMQAKLDRIFDAIRSIVAATRDGENMQGTIAQKVEQLRLHQGVETKRAHRRTRFVDRPLPLRQVERKAATEEVTAGRASTIAPSPAASAGGPTPRALGKAPDKADFAPELVALAQELGDSPARIFRFVHDEIALDPKWGSFTGSLGALWARSGTSWDQALLLRELLAAAGVDARLEWGEVEISTETLVNLAGVSDAVRAGDLLTTAGLPIVLYTQGSQVVGARLSHVWVKAHLDYIPNRGVTGGPGDTWIRMDPSFARIDYAPGIRIHDQVPFFLGDYLLSGTELSPIRTYQDALWAYIRANDIACVTLEQLKPAASVRQERFPFVPGTLRAKILSVEGEATSVPAAFAETLEVVVRTSAGAPLLTWNAPVPATYSQRHELGWRGATAGDQATLAAMGGVFETPPYLVDLVPVVLLDGVEQVAGSAIGSAEEVEIAVTLTPANGPVDVFVHEGYAGEPGVLVTAFGRLPQQVLTRHQEARAAAAASGDAAVVESTGLQLLGTTYFQNLGRDADDVAGWTWHRLLRLVSEGLVVQTGNVTTALGGSPLTFTRAETFVDFPGFVVGLFHATGALGIARPTLELAGAQGSFLEGAVFDEVTEQEGIAAVSALTRAQRAGQTLTRVDSSNLDAVLGSVDLGPGVEDQVRGAIGNGKIAWVPEAPVEVNSWRGTGFVLKDPTTGAAAYLLSGGFAGGADTGKRLGNAAKTLGDESWITNGPLGGVIGFLLRIFGGAPGDDGDPEGGHGDPVNLATGNFWTTTSDLQIQARGRPIQWSRTYNSQSTHHGLLGHGWTFGYGESLGEQIDGSILYREGDGSEHLFQLVEGALVAPAGKHLALTRLADGFEMRFKDGLVKRFDAAGRLLSETDRNGNAITLVYDAGGNLTSLLDPAGRTVLTVTIQGGRVIRLTDLSGREVVYQYTGSDLTSVTDTGGHDQSLSYDSNHNLVAISNPMGHADTYTYDSFDRCIRHTNPLGHEELFAYTRIGESAVVTDVRGFETLVELDERGRALAEVDALGNARRSTWDEDNNRTSTTDARGGTTARTFDDRGNMLSETNPLNETTSFTYDPAFNQVVSTTDPTLDTVTADYDANGNLERTSRVVDGQTVEQNFSYDSFGQMIEYRDALNHPTTITWDPAGGTVTTLSDAAGATTIFSTDDLGRITGLEDAEGNHLVLGYDEQDRVVSIEDPHGNSRSIDFDAAGRQLALNDSRGTTTFEYDDAGRQIDTMDPLGQRTTTTYDPGGNILSRTDARGFSFFRTWDALGRMTSLIDAQGAVWSWGFCAEIGAGQSGPAELDSSGSFCQMTDPLGRTITQEHDDLGRVRKVTDPLGLSAEIEYDELGRKVRTLDPLHRETRFEYNDFGDLTAVVEANTGRTEYTYDLARNRINVRDAEQRDWPRTFDTLNRLRTESDPLGHTITYFYDGLGNLIRKQKPDGTEITYAYDVRRLTEVRLPGGAVETYTYDAFGRRVGMVNNEVSISYAFDEVNRLAQVTNHTLAQAITYDYDPVGNLVRMDGPEGVVEYAYDSRDLLVEQSDPVTGRYRFAYDALGIRTRLEYPNGVETTYDYDAAARLTHLVSRDASGAVVDGHSYAYDDAGNRIGSTALRDGVSHTFEYDEVNRLERWQRDVDRFETYTYDLVGNRQTLADEQGTTTYSYDDANRLIGRLQGFTQGASITSTFVSDLNGNVISKTVGAVTTNYGWDALNRLTQVDGGAGVSTYGYDPNGIRVRQTEGGETTRFLHAPSRAGFGQILGVYDGAGQQQAYFTHGPEIDEPLAQVAAGQTNYLHRDGRWSVTALSSSEGQLSGFNSYAPFGGVEESGGVGSRYGFTGRELDAGGLMYYRARYYEPDLGRFLSADTFRGNQEVPASQHSFSYVQNNPLTRVDPSGNFTLLAVVIGVIAGIIFGAAIGSGALPFGASLGMFWGAFIGGVVAFILLGGVGSFFNIGGNLNTFLRLSLLRETQLEWTLFSRLFGRFFGIHYGKHIGGKILLHIHLGSSFITGWAAVLIALFAVALVLLAVYLVIYLVAILFYE
ncbi:MAG: hypothetical protein GY722_27640 [bacterium]|nr:hypothetical protein [bacterium]